MQTVLLARNETGRRLWREAKNALTTPLLHGTNGSQQSYVNTPHTLGKNNSVFTQKKLIGPTAAADPSDMMADTLLATVSEIKIFYFYWSLVKPFCSSIPSRLCGASAPPGCFKYFSNIDP